MISVSYIYRMLSVYKELFLNCPCLFEFRITTMAKSENPGTYLVDLNDTFKHIKQMEI